FDQRGKRRLRYADLPAQLRQVSPLRMVPQYVDKKIDLDSGHLMILQALVHLRRQIKADLLHHKKQVFRPEILFHPYLHLLSELTVHTQTVRSLIFCPLEILAQKIMNVKFKIIIINKYYL